MNVFVDDVRDPKRKYPDWVVGLGSLDWVVVRTGQEALELLLSGKPIEVVSFDYDLGWRSDYTGLEVMREYCMAVLQDEVPRPREILIHTGSYSARQLMEKLVEELREAGIPINE